MTEKKITVMIQARTGSTRLSGKVLSQIEDKPMIWHVINRVKEIKFVEQIALITTKEKSDQTLLEIAENEKIIGFSGNTMDVLDRHYQCALRLSADPIIRITGDCPLIDPYIVEEMLKIFINHDYDYISNIHPPTYPDGLDTEIFSFKTLQQCHKNAKLPSEREHVTPFISKNPDKFKLFNFENKENLSKNRWTVDEKEDLKFVKLIYEKMRPKKIFNFEQILQILKNEPDLIEINNQIKRNEGWNSSYNLDKKFEKAKD